MPSEPQPFIRIKPAKTGEAAVVAGWREGDGSESVAFQLPLKSAVRALFDELDVGLVLLPSGVVALDAAALPAGELETLLADKGLPQATFSKLVDAMIEQIANAPDASDGEDLRRLAQDFEQAARALRAALAEIKTAI
jgi:hypothetical protein